MTDSRALQLRAGDLTHQFTIFSPALTLNATDTVVATGVWMSISAMDMKEYMALGGIQAAAAYTVVCHYRTDIRLDAQLREECCQQRRLQILSMVPTDRNEGLVMVCVVPI